VALALPARLVRPAPRALKASKDPSDLRAQLESRGLLALRDRQDQSAPRGRREKRVPKARSDPPASADHQGRKAPLAHPAPPDQLARRVTPARHRQFASSPVRIAFAAKATKSWLVLFARAVRPTERSARPPARQRPAYVYIDDLCRVATASTFSNSTMLAIKQRHQRSRRFRSKFAVGLYDQFGRLRCVIRFDRRTGSRNRGASAFTGNGRYRPRSIPFEASARHGENPRHDRV
jgi:hypothetical protein